LTPTPDFGFTCKRESKETLLPFTPDSQKNTNTHKNKMKLKKLFLTAVLALAGMAAITPSAKATYGGDGDLLMGFYDTASSKDYILDLGQYTNYTTAGGVYTGSLITLNSASFGTTSQIYNDLYTAFGTDLGTSAVKFGVIGVYDYLGSNTLFVTDPNATSTTPSYASDTSANQQGPAAVIENNIGQDFGAKGGSATAGEGDIQSKTAPGSYYSYSAPQNSGFSLQYYATGATGSGIDKALNSSATSYLIEQVAVDGLENGAPPEGDSYDQTVGVFTVSTVGSNTTITYGAAVPEPSTYALSGVGALMLFVLARRKNYLKA
jgi:hypothetical protein